MSRKVEKHSDLETTHNSAIPPCSLKFGKLSQACSGCSISSNFIDSQCSVDPEVLYA